MMAAPGSQYCPRCSFLLNFEAEKKRNKAVAELAASVAGVKKSEPNTKASLLHKGYVFVGAKECSGCGKMIEWWRTPNLKNAPFDPMMTDAAVARSHFATCPNAAAYRRSA